MSATPAPDSLGIDEAPFGLFHLRLTIYSCGGPFCDGYILGIIAIALAPLSKELGLNSVQEGLIAAGSLLGMFIGGAACGYITDLVGRRLMYTLDLLVLVLGSIGQLWVTGMTSLFLLRFLLGVAIGADYPIAAALLAEFAPRRQRGMLMASMIGAWWLGYTVSFLMGYELIALAGTGFWRWILASSAVPAAGVILLRWGMPESPRWLISKGRVAEARAILSKHLHIVLSAIDVTPDTRVASNARSSYAELFKGPYLRRTIFVCTFWSCQIVPTFAIFTFSPALLQAFGSKEPILGAALMSIWFIIGVVPAILSVDSIGRRPVLLIPFVVQAVVLALLPFLLTTMPVAISACFILFAIANSASSVLQWVYPSELFPTHIRATGLGFCTAISRISAAGGTFLFPVGMNVLGANVMMFLVAGICAAGFIASYRFAPETRGMSLRQASASSSH